MNDARITQTHTRPQSRRHATAHPHHTTRQKVTCGCGCTQVHRGRAADGRRAYQCAACERVWTAGTQGRAPQHSAQRPGYQFAHTGAARQTHTGAARQTHTGSRA